MSSPAGRGPERTSEPMSTAGAVRLVIGREVITRFRSKAFRITTVVNLLVLVGFALAFKLIGAAGTSQEVGFTPSAQSLAAPLVSVADAVGQTVEPSTVDRAAGERQLRDGKIDALVTGAPDAFQVVVRQDLSPGLHDAFSVLARQVVLNNEIARAGGDPAAVTAAANSTSVDVRSLEPVRQHQTARIVLMFIAGILVYVSVMLYGQLVAQGVVEEKASRVVEILLTTIRPWQLMLGKVLGIGLVGLSQMLVTVVAGVSAGLALDAFSFPTSIATDVAVWAVVWFLLGYLVFALLLGALGALVSRQEDVGGVTAPALVVIITPYVLAATMLPADPDNSIMEYASLFPFFSSTIMPMRVALGVAPLWQNLLAVALNLLLIVGLVWFAGRVYRNAVLRMGARVRLREALFLR